MSEARPVRHFAVVVLETPDERVILQHRDDRADIGHPDHWGLFGGRVEMDETPHQGACRELLEELALTVTPEDVRALGVFHLEPGKLHHAFQCRVDVTMLTVAPREGQGAAAWPAEDVARGRIDGRPVIPSHARIVRKWLER